ncbi:hypothetical protein C8R41DRAFT_183047 [Lentinula lateritia]|uniref:Uncharacterized protein n=1 Tax=Lentinula lateritia TaxID=40482 RepID=A0ABQ8VR80_9AGAR|nr:hypothetical protein C8R41DRAFT_183047 [Lentinula lateritia]
MVSPKKGKGTNLSSARPLHWRLMSLLDSVVLLLNVSGAFRALGLYFHPRPRNGTYNQLKALSILPAVLHSMILDLHMLPFLVWTSKSTLFSHLISV